MKRSTLALPLRVGLVLAVAVCVVSYSPHCDQTQAAPVPTLSFVDSPADIYDVESLLAATPDSLNWTRQWGRFASNENVMVIAGSWEAGDWTGVPRDYLECVLAGDPDCDTTYDSRRIVNWIHRGFLFLPPGDPAGWASRGKGLVTHTNAVPQPNKFEAWVEKMSGRAGKYEIPILAVFENPDIDAEDDLGQTLGYFTTMIDEHWAYLRTLPDGTMGSDELRLEVLSAMTRSLVLGGSLLRGLVRDYVAQNFPYSTAQDPVQDLLYTGGSKWGYTSWLATAIDPRSTSFYAAAYEGMDVAGRGGAVRRYVTDWSMCGVDGLGTLQWIFTQNGWLWRQYFEPIEFRHLYEDKFIVNGTHSHDFLYPVGSSTDFWECMKDAGVDHRTVIFPNSGHHGNQNYEHACFGLVPEIYLAHVATGSRFWPAIEITSLSLVGTDLTAVVEVQDDGFPTDRTVSLWWTSSTDRYLGILPGDATQGNPSLDYFQPETMSLSGPNEYAVTLSVPSGELIACYAEVVDKPYPQLGTPSTLRIAPECETISTTTFYFLNESLFPPEDCGTTLPTPPGRCQ